ncbi:GFA family protein [Rhizobium sp. YJ-22]|uniref:GFA family protein n=1 Tax=Rhizobium sp. YJ-22 TaxID=3037556 RepID=UPI002412A724|nr:GFA family protein [Rhizobium sp. YJ-22]MDG3577293.1 GFA family protein [Rhizobium sp. YJ-22]
MTIHTGGCQCGAVRFRVDGDLHDSSICHCRMCQKAFGAYYAPLVSTRGANLSWTRGRPKTFRSSNYATRGFCVDCGTPLTFEAPDGIALAAGAFDDPAGLPPHVQFGIENKIDFVDRLYTLPGHDTLEDADAAPYLNDVVSYQHPDHDTDVWPPLEKPS